MNTYTMLLINENTSKNASGMFLNMFSNMIPYLSSNNLYTGLNDISLYQKVEMLFSNILSIKDTPYKILHFLQETYIGIAKNWKNLLVGGVLTIAIISSIYFFIRKKINVLNTNILGLEKVFNNVTKDIYDNIISLLYLKSQSKEILDKINFFDSPTDLVNKIQKDVIAGKVDSEIGTHIIFTIKNMNKNELKIYLQKLANYKIEKDKYDISLSKFTQSKTTYEKYKRLMKIFLCIFLISGIFMLLLPIFNKYITSYLEKNKKEEKNTLSYNNNNNMNIEDEIKTESQEQLKQSSTLVKTIFKIVNYLHNDISNFSNWIKNKDLGTIAVYCTGISFFGIIFTKSRATGLSVKQTTQGVIKGLMSNNFIHVGIIWIALGCVCYVFKNLNESKEIYG